MIYRMTADVAALLAARKFPFAVTYGPERTMRAQFPHSTIVIDRDRNGSETIGPAHGVQRNPKKVLGRFLPCRAIVWAASTLDGARRNEHEHECDRFVDGLLAALEDWATEAQAEIRYASARFATAADLGTDEQADLEVWPGVVYALAFNVGRGVFARDYTGAGQPEGAIAGAGMRGRVEVQRQGADGPPEVIEIG